MKFALRPGTLFSFPARKSAPLAWRLCGTHAVRRVYLSDEFFTEDDIARVHALFPEADDIVLRSHNDPWWEREPKLEHRAATKP
jgi:hypothetical protein